MGQVHPDTCLKPPDNTYIASYDNSLVISGIFGSKTIRGDHASISKSLIIKCDGETPLGDIFEEIDNTIITVAEILCEEGILYSANQLSSLDLSEQYRNLFESVLLGLEPENRDTFSDDILSQTIALSGADTSTKQLASILRSVGWSVDTAQSYETPDIILFTETTATTDTQRRKVNSEWVDSEAVLLRIALEGDTIEIGPILTPSANACLECLTIREKMNDATDEFAYESVNPAPSYGLAAVQKFVLGIIVHIAADSLPPEMVGIIRQIDLSTFEQQASSLVGIPGCEYCGF